jgi:hypothetical protein
MKVKVDNLLSPLVEPIPRIQKYILKEDYQVSFNLVTDVGTVEQMTVRVPKSFIYNGASIPRPFWTLFTTPFNPLVMAPALVHDWIYYTHHIDRLVSDKLFKVMCEANGISAIKSYVKYRAIRFGGYFSWKSFDEFDRNMMLSIICDIKNGSGNYSKYGLDTYINFNNINVGTLIC